MSTNLKEWITQVDAWRKQYGVQPEDRSVDLTAVSVCCFRCKRLKAKMHRHHTGNDMIFARMLPDHFAANYVRFRREDWEKLCADCHKKAHKIGKELMIDFWDELNKHGQKIATPEWCEAWRQKFRAAFYEWAAKYKPRLATKPRRRHR